MPSSAPSAVKSPPVTSSGPVAEADVSALRAALKANQTDAARTQAVSLLQSNGGALENEAVRKLVRKLLVTLVQEKHPAAAETFELVGSSQGSRGPDLLYDLLEGSGRAAWADLAASTLAKPAVVAHSSLAMSLALKLRTLPCDDKLALVDQAVESGDERAVVAMQIVVRGCVRDTRRVDGAIRRLKDRLQKG